MTANLSPTSILPVPAGTLCKSPFTLNVLQPELTISPHPAPHPTPKHWNHPRPRPQHGGPGSAASPKAKVKATALLKGSRVLPGIYRRNLGTCLGVRSLGPSGCSIRDSVGPAQNLKTRTKTNVVDKPLPRGQVRGASARQVST